MRDDCVGNLRHDKRVRVGEADAVAVEAGVVGDIGGQAHRHCLCCIDLGSAAHTDHAVDVAGSGDVGGSEYGLAGYVLWCGGEYLGDGVAEVDS